MFHFTAQGRIGRIDRLPTKNAGDASIVRVSVVTDHQVQGQHGAWTKTEWLNAVSFDPALNEKLLSELEVGQSAALDGRIETRRRAVGDRNITDFSFVITRFAPLLQPDGEPPPAEAAA